MRFLSLGIARTSGVSGIANHRLEADMLRVRNNSLVTDAARLQQLVVDANDRVQVMADVALSAKIELHQLRRTVKGSSIDKLNGIQSIVDECFRAGQLVAPFDTDDD